MFLTGQLQRYHRELLPGLDHLLHHAGPSASAIETSDETASPIRTSWDAFDFTNNSESAIVSPEEVIARQPSAILFLSELVHKVRNGPVLQVLIKSLLISLGLLLSSFQCKCYELDGNLRTRRCNLCCQKLNLGQQCQGRSCSLFSNEPYHVATGSGRK